MMLWQTLIEDLEGYLASKKYGDLTKHWGIWIWYGDLTVIEDFWQTKKGFDGSWPTRIVYACDQQI